MPCRRGYPCCADIAAVAHLLRRILLLLILLRIATLLRILLRVATLLWITVALVVHGRRGARARLIQE